MTQTADIKGHGSGNRAKAAHCEALLGKAPQVADTAALVDDFGKALAAALKNPLAELMGGAKPKITCATHKRVDASTCADKQEPLAAHFVLGEADGAGALVATIGAAGALTLCDRAFGGNGEVADPLPEKLPMSADLTLGRLGKCLSSAMANVLHGSEITLRARGEKLARILPFGRIAECVSIEISIEEGERDPWTIRLLAEAASLNVWLNECNQQADTAFDSHVGGVATDGPAPAKKTIRNTGSLYQIALPVTAILGECKLPLARVSRLKAGDLIPLSMRREVPLMVGTSEVAAGTVGTVDDQVALQITRTFQNNTSTKWEN